MTRHLPPNPSPKQLRNQARDILKAHKRHDAACCEVLRRLRQFTGKPDPDILAAAIQLNQVQFALAMDYGFRTWNDLLAYAAHKDHTYLEDSYLSHDDPIRQSGFGGEIRRLHTLGQFFHGSPPLGLLRLLGLNPRTGAQQYRQCQHQQPQKPDVPRPDQRVG